MYIYLVMLFIIIYIVINILQKVEYYSNNSRYTTCTYGGNVNGGIYDLYEGECYSSESDVIINNIKGNCNKNISNLKSNNDKLLKHNNKLQVIYSEKILQCEQKYEKIISELEKKCEKSEEITTEDKIKHAKVLQKTLSDKIAELNK